MSKLTEIESELYSAIDSNDDAAGAAAVSRLVLFAARQLERIADALEARNVVPVTATFEVHDAQGRLDL